MKTRKLNQDNLRNIIFGAEDSLVSTVGVLFGVASAAYDTSAILFTGIVVIAVEALSMGAGAFLSEESANDFAALKTGNMHEKRTLPILDGILMFFSYFLTGLIPLTPYVFWSTEVAKYLSVSFSLIALFVLGYLPAKRVNDALRMVIVAGFAVALGFLIGSMVRL